MKILCIAASQVANRGEESYSFKIAEMVKQITVDNDTNSEVNIIHLAEKKLIPCCMCLKCSDSGLCIYDDSFNEIHCEMKQADIIFIVCPHYAGLPSKLTIILEKLEEICYILMCNKEVDKWALKNKPMGLIVHGGSTDSYIHLYENTVLKPLAYICKSIGLKLKDSQDYNNGIIFGVKGYENVENSNVPDMVYDYSAIKQVLKPFVKQYL